MRDELLPVLLATLALTKAAAASGVGITPCSRPGTVATSAREVAAEEEAAVLTVRAFTAPHPPEPHPPSLKRIAECPVAHAWEKWLSCLYIASVSAYDPMCRESKCTIFIWKIVGCREEHTGIREEILVEEEDFEKHFLRRRGH